MITKAKIENLFNNVWRDMHGQPIHLDTCLKKYDLIERLFNKHKFDFDNLLEALLQIEGIAITIATGLIWCSYPNKAVPFDKYTLAYCLEKKWLKTDIVSDDYKAKCKIVIKKIKESKSTDTVLDMVYEALVKMKGVEWVKTLTAK
jgi:hypothetical protein